MKNKTLIENILQNSGILLETKKKEDIIPEPTGKMIKSFLNEYGERIKIYTSEKPSEFIIVHSDMPRKQFPLIKNNSFGDFWTLENGLDIWNQNEINLLSKEMGIRIVLRNKHYNI